MVILNLRFDGGWRNNDEASNGSDAVHLRNNTHQVWIHQCTFHNWISGAIEARSDNDSDVTPHHISVTESHFYDIHI